MSTHANLPNPSPRDDQWIVMAGGEPYLTPPLEEAQPLPPAAPRWRLAIALFILTCLSTFSVYGVLAVAKPPGNWTGADAQRFVASGLLYAVPLMVTLLAHELGHYIQARRYRVPASLPYFIPMPISPIGTMGAVIAMRGRMGTRRALFDIGITGPLAGLIPALTCSVVGLAWSRVVPLRGELGDPLLFRGLVRLFFGPLPPGHDVALHPIAFAGWVGVFITSLNLMPIGQLDGGHILYALLRQKAHIVATLLLYGAIAAVVYSGRYQWAVMLVLLSIMGPRHPPTADDEVPLGAMRIVLGWLTLAFIVVGFTPTPFM